MVNRRLYKIVRIYIGFGLGYFLLGIALFLFCHPQALPAGSTDTGALSTRDYYQLYKDLIPIIVFIPGSFLAYSFQRRSSYLQALRDLWKSLIPTVQRAIQYTHVEAPDTKEFAEVQKELSTMIDTLRGVFKNIPYQDDLNGLYPFEPLKDIKKTVAWIHNNQTKENQALARRVITRLWYQVHSAMLLEFDREVPVRPVSKFLLNVPSVADKLMAGTLKEEDLRKQ